MTRKLLILAALAVFAACACYGETDSQTIQLAMGAASGATTTVTGVSGMLDAVYASASDGTSTGTVAVAIVPADAKVSAINVATGSTVGLKVWRPSTDRTAVDGSALTSDPPGRFILVNDTVRLIVTSSPTNLTWRATLKLEK